MKNKKILSRILALCSVVVLLFALALPCFADETEQPFTDAELWELFAQSDDNYNDNSAYVLLRENQFNNIDIFSANNLYLFSMQASSIGEFYTYGLFNRILDPDLQSSDFYEIPFMYGVLACTLDGSDEPDFTVDVKDIEIHYRSGDSLIIRGFDLDHNLCFYIEYDYNDGYEFLEIEISDGDYTYGNGSIQGDAVLDFVFLTESYWVRGSDDFYASFTDDAYTVLYPAGFAQGYTSGYATNRPDGVVPPAKTGLFGQLYYILADAIYGENVTLGSTQDFALTLVTTLLVLCVVLLPVLLVVAIMFKLFRW